jgi:hypothetical protein
MNLTFEARNAHSPLPSGFEDAREFPGRGQAVGGAHADVQPPSGPLDRLNVSGPSRCFGAGHPDLALSAPATEGRSPPGRSAEEIRSAGGRLWTPA